MVTLEILPTPPADYPYVVVLLVAICVILLGGIIFGGKLAINLSREHIKELKQQVKDERERADRILSEARSAADAAAEVARRQWETGEQRRADARERLRGELATSTRELTAHIDESVGKIEVKSDAQGETIVHILRSIQRLEDQLNLKPIKEI
jgi:hypothetical protein